MWQPLICLVMIMSSLAYIKAEASHDLIDTEDPTKLKADKAEASHDLIDKEDPTKLKADKDEVADYLMGQVIRSLLKGDKMDTSDGKNDLKDEGTTVQYECKYVSGQQLLGDYMDEMSEQECTNKCLGEKEKDNEIVGAVYNTVTKSCACGIDVDFVAAAGYKACVFKPKVKSSPPVSDWQYATCGGLKVDDQVFSMVGEWTKKSCFERCVSDDARFCELLPESRVCRGYDRKGVFSSYDSDVNPITYCTEVKYAVDGGWSAWSIKWDYYCSRSCGNGQQTSKRLCNNPTPLNGGKPCPGKDTKVEKCSAGHCPVYGAWSKWSTYGPCSKSCGGGTKKKTRECNDPPPKYGGSCWGKWNGHGMEKITEKTWTCNRNICPVDGSWGEWSDYGQCSKTCGGGSQKKTRECNNPKPSYRGRECSGDKEETKSCNNDKCGVDGSWGEWSDYGQCSKTCGGGSQKKTRACNDPKPAHGGKECSGDKEETKSCNNDKCGEFLIESPTAIGKGKFVTKVTMEKEYTVTFDVFATALLPGWRSVIHFTASGRNAGKYGDRIPAVYFYGNKISIASAVSGNGNYYVYSKPVKANKWYTVVIKQTKEADGKYWYTNTVDGKSVIRNGRVVNTDPRRFENVKVYAGDPWYYPAAGKIRNLSVTVG